MTNSATTASITGPCSTSTVTDYWVSCSYSSASEFCTTISKAVVTGCSITASTTTTFPVCLLQNPAPTTAITVTEITTGTPISTINTASSISPSPTSQSLTSQSSFGTSSTSPTTIISSSGTTSLTSAPTLSSTPTTGTQITTSPTNIPASDVGNSNRRNLVKV